jgi:hypothetical protein
MFNSAHTHNAHDRNAANVGVSSSFVHHITTHHITFHCITSHYVTLQRERDERERTRARERRRRNDAAAATTTTTTVATAVADDVAHYDASDVIDDDDAGGVPKVNSRSLSFSKLIIDVVQARGLNHRASTTPTPPVMHTTGRKKGAATTARAGGNLASHHMCAYAVISFQAAAGQTEPILLRRPSPAHDKRHSTAAATTATFAPHWNTNFCFDVAPPGCGGGDDGDDDENIYVTVFSRRRRDGSVADPEDDDADEDDFDDAFLGEVVIPVSELRDQMKRTVWLPLAGTDTDTDGGDSGGNGNSSGSGSGGGGAVNGEVELSLLWLHDVLSLVRSLRAMPTPRRRRMLDDIQFSKLIVDVVDGVSLTRAGGGNVSVAAPYLILSFDDADAQTDVCAAQARPSWNVNFTFDVNAAIGAVFERNSARADAGVAADVSLVVSLHDAADDDGDGHAGRALATAAVPLTALADQRRHTRWLTLLAPRNNNGNGGGGAVCGHVRLKMLFLYSLRRLVDETAAVATL